MKYELQIFIEKSIEDIQSECITNIGDIFTVFDSIGKGLIKKGIDSTKVIKMRHQNFSFICPECKRIIYGDQFTKCFLMWSEYGGAKVISLNHEQRLGNLMTIAELDSGNSIIVAGKGKILRLYMGQCVNEACDSKMAIMNWKPVEIWKNKLSIDSNWQGLETIFHSYSEGEILEYLFDYLFPAMPVVSKREVNIVFDNLKINWASEQLVVTDINSINSIILANLIKDSQEDDFIDYFIDIGTEGNPDNRLYWMARISNNDFELLSKTKYAQINTNFKNSFRGYRIWKAGANEVYFAAMSNSILTNTI